MEKIYDLRKPEDGEAYYAEGCKLLKPEHELYKLYAEAIQKKDISIMKKIDKSEWPDGPWKDEPDFDAWIDEETGYECLILRHPQNSGGFNGYVFTPISASFSYKKEEELKDIIKDIYGSLCFFNHDFPYRKHYGVRIRYIEITADRNPLGLPHIDSRGLRRPLTYDDYKDIKFVKKECTSLARQLKALEKK